MAIKTSDIPTILIERIEAAHPAPAHFEVAETDDWPTDSLSALLKQGVLVAADRARATTCPGCEWQCQKHVVVRNVGSISRAFITCDEEPELGRICVSLRSLQRVMTDLRTLSLFVARATKRGMPRVAQSLAAYALGAVKGRHGLRPIFIAIEDGRLVLGVGEQREPLAHVLVWGTFGLTFDTRQVRRLADRKAAATPERRQYTRNRFQQASRKNATRKRDHALLQEAKRLRDRGGATWSSVASEIVRTGQAGRLTVERVRRIISEQLMLERKKLRSKSENPK
jgi:hypothetical protein